jgi:hypothetical protein
MSAVTRDFNLVGPGILAIGAAELAVFARGADARRVRALFVFVSHNDLLFSTHLSDKCFRKLNRNSSSTPGL